MTSCLCFVAHKSWLIVLRSPLRFATWHHNEQFSYEIALFNGVTVFENVNWHIGLLNGVEIPSCVAKLVFFIQMVRKWERFVSSSVQQFMLGEWKGTKFACLLKSQICWILSLISLMFAFHAHPFSLVIHACAFLHIDTWMLPITSSALLLTTEQLQWRTQGHHSDCSLVRRECYSRAFSTHLCTFPAFKMTSLQSPYSFRPQTFLHCSELEAFIAS